MGEKLELVHSYLKMQASEKKQFNTKHLGTPINSERGVTLGLRTNGNYMDLRVTPQSPQNGREVIRRRALPLKFNESAINYDCIVVYILSI